MTPPRATPLTKIANRQHGHVSTGDLLRLGLSHEAIRWRVKTGLLIPVFPGVYAVGHLPFGPHGRWTAAVLACSPDAFLAYESAAVLHGFWHRESGGTHVLALRHLRGARGITVHETRHLPSGHTMRRLGIPVTTPLRTLLDLADVLSPDEYVRAAMEAEHRRLVSFDALVAGRMPGRGGPAMRELLLHVHEQTRSQLERRFLRFCRDQALPKPLVNHRIGSRRADFAWPAQRFIVETDGFRDHRGRKAFERDRRRIAIFRAAGWDVLPTTWRQVTSEPALVRAAVAAGLGCRT